MARVDCQLDTRLTIWHNQGVTALKNRARVRSAHGTKSLTIELYEVIDSFAWLWGGATAKTIRETLNEHPDANEIHVRINTDGGEVSEGIAIMTAWAEHPARVITHNDGKAFSMGSLILLSGDERRMSRGADIMAHEPWTMAMGTGDDLRSVADQLDSKADDLAALYSQATGHSVEQWKEWLRATTWWSADEAKSDGLIDEITDTVAARAQLRGDEYPHIPTRLLMQAARKETSMAVKKTEPKPDDTPDKPDIEAIKQQERARVTQIQAIGKKLGVKSELVKAAIDDGKSVEEFRAKAVDEFQAAEPPKLPPHGRAHITSGDDAADKWQRCMVGRLVEVANMTESVATVCKAREIPFEARPRELMNMNLVDLARESLRRAGKDPSRMRRMEMIGAAFQMGAGYDSTGHFPVAFEDALHKMLLAEYELQDPTWRQFCATGRLSDFRPHFRYRLSELGVWQIVLENGEYQNVGLNDARREQLKADKYGNIIAVTREMIMNDDMSTILGQVRAFARAGAYTPELAVYDLLKENGGFGPNMTDGNPLYHASHNNIGASSILSVAGLDADRTVFRRQKDDNNKRFLNLRPSRLVISTELWSQATIINESRFDIDEVAAASTNKFEVPNSVRGMFEVIVDAPEITGPVRRLFADPRVQPVIEVGFLEGMQEPMIERQEGWRIDGTEWKGRLEFGVGAVDFNGTVYNAGV